MFIKQDYDYQEIEQFISSENMQLYELIKANGQQDNFTFMIEMNLSDAPTIEQLNDYMKNNVNKIKEFLKLK